MMNLLRREFQTHLQPRDLIERLLKDALNPEILHLIEHLRTMALLLVVKRMRAWWCPIIRRILHLSATRAQGRLDAAYLLTGFSDPVGRLWWRKGFTAILRRLLQQVRQRATMDSEKSKLLVDGFLVEGHSAT